MLQTSEEDLIHCITVLLRTYILLLLPTTSLQFFEYIFIPA